MSPQIWQIWVFYNMFLEKVTRGSEKKIAQEKKNSMKKSMKTKSMILSTPSRKTVGIVALDGYNASR